VKTLQADIRACRAAKSRDALAKEQRDRELKILTTHLHWALRVADDAAELERVTKSLETARRRIRVGS